MKKKILTIGSGMFDVFLEYQHTLLPCRKDLELKTSYLELEVGRKLELDAIERHTGGGATNSAVSFARQGFDVTSFFKIGNDCEGAFILNQLSQEGVHTASVVKTADTSTGTSIIFPCPGGDRTVLLHRGASLMLQENELPIKELEQADVVYITSLSQNAASLLETITHTTQGSTTIAVNPGTSQLVSNVDSLKKALPAIDILIVNAFEAGVCMNALAPEQRVSSIDSDTSEPLLLREKLCYKKTSFYLRDYFKKVLQSGPTYAVVTNGADGVYVAHKNTMYYHKSLPQTVVSTLGAGDAFGSTFVASLVESKSVQEALVNGLVNATSVISFLDAKKGLLTKQVLEKKAQKIGSISVKLYDL